MEAKSILNKKWLRRLAIALIWVAVWQAATFLAGSELILPGPFKVAGRFLALLGEPMFYSNAGLSLFRILCGYVIAVLAGTLLAALSAWSPFVKELLAPLIAVARATPVVSFILLVILWFSKNVVPMFISFLMVLPMVYANVHEGILRTDTQLLEMAKAFRLGRKKTFTAIYVPSVLPHFLTACTTGLGFAWKAGVAAEVLCTPKLSIGARLYESKLYIETVDLFAWTLLVILLSLVLEYLLRKFLNKLRREDRA